MGDSTASWYVLYTKPQKEHRVSSFLEAQGIETYYPVLKHADQPKAVPLFPRYVFARVVLRDFGISNLRWIGGVSRLVEFEGELAVVPNHVMHHLKQHVDRLQRAETDPKTFKAGEPVRIVEGPLAGYEGIFDLHLWGSERVRIFLSLLGRTIRVKVNGRAIEKKC